MFGHANKFSFFILKVDTIVCAKTRVELPMQVICFNQIRLLQVWIEKHGRPYDNTTMACLSISKGNNTELK